MRILGIILGMILVSNSLMGCMLTSGNISEINTLPSGALVTVEGLGQCETPCTLELEQRRLLTIAKAGYKPVRIMLKPNGKNVSIELQLAAPTKDVDTVALPEIQ